MNRAWKSCVLVCACLFLSGCGGYQLRGIVLDGMRPGIYIVEQDDPRLKEPGIANASIELTLDPNKLRPRALGGTITRADGTFSVPINAAGAGFLEYDIGLYVRSKGFSPLDSGAMALPPDSRRLLIVMVPGVDKARRSQGSLLEEIRRETKKFNPK